MAGERYGRLAVARLDELSQEHRQSGGTPLQGFCLISEEVQRYRVTLYIENGRALGGPSGVGNMHYEGWLVGPGGPVSLGPFDLGSSGSGSATQVVDEATLQPDRAELMRVTAEPSDGGQFNTVTVLEGRLIWLETGETDGVQQSPATVESVEEPDLQTVAFQAGAETSAGTSLLEAALGAEVAPIVEPAEVSVNPPSADLLTGVGQAAPEPTASDPPSIAQESREPTASDPPGIAQESSEPTASVEPIRAVAAPATPTETESPTPSPAAPEARPVRPNELSIQLVQRHPMAPRSGGTAAVNLKQGTLSLALRGLPSPTALGRDQATGRPFNTYRVWLLNQETGVRIPVGFCQRAWGENFRFQGEGLPLGRHDSVLITVEDRTAPGANHVSPQVLLGSYS